MAKSKLKLFLPNDRPEMSSAIIELVKVHRYFVRRCSADHIKVYDHNYWPRTGAITVDGFGRHLKKGLQEYINLLKTRYPKRSRKTRPQPSPGDYMSVPDLDFSNVESFREVPVEPDEFSLD